MRELQAHRDDVDIFVFERLLSLHRNEGGPVEKGGNPVIGQVDVSLREDIEGKMSFLDHSDRGGHRLAVTPVPIDREIPESLHGPGVSAAAEEDVVGGEVTGWNSELSMEFRHDLRVGVARVIDDKDKSIAFLLPLAKRVEFPFEFQLANPMVFPGKGEETVHLPSRPDYGSRRAGRKKLIGSIGEFEHGEPLLSDPFYYRIPTSSRFLMQARSLVA